MLRNRTTATWAKKRDEVTVDLSAIQGNLGEVRMSSQIFLNTFNPFRPRSAVRETIGTYPFLEHLSDYFMFTDDSYDHARRISSVRYGLECSCFSAVVGMLTALAIFGALDPREAWSRISTAVLVLVILGGAYLLVARAWYASAEYEARLNLLTLLTLRNRSPDPSDGPLGQEG